MCFTIARFELFLNAPGSQGCKTRAFKLVQSFDEVVHRKSAVDSWVLPLSPDCAVEPPKHPLQHVKPIGENTVRLSDGANLDQFSTEGPGNKVPTLSVLGQVNQMLLLQSTSKRLLGKVFFGN